MTNKLTYQERAIAINQEAINKTCRDATRHWENAEAAKKEMDSEKIKVFNELRSVGICMNEASGRGQLTFNLNGKAFVRDLLLPNLPKNLSVSKIQCCCHIANVVKEPVKTIEELRIVEHEMNPIFVEHFGESKKKRELTSHEARNLFSTLVTKTTDWVQIFDDLASEEPLEKWSDEKLDEGIENGRPMDERYQRMVKIRVQRLNRAGA